MVEIVDIVGLSENAYLALWGFVTSVDLVDVVRLGHTTLDDPLPWSLTDRRAVRVVGEEDGLWLRILDPVACLRERLHDAVGGPVSLRVTDELGICGGSYRIDPHPAGVRVSRLDPDAPADATLDVSALGSVFLGGFSPTTLERAGRIACASPAVAPQLDRLFGSSQAPYNGTHF
jgi:predicted acetyltransferase